MLNARKLFFAMLLVVVSATFVQAQELRCQLTVNGQRVNGVDPSIFQNMQQSLNNFMNTRVWTTDQFAPEERIDCNIFINIEKSPEQDIFEARVTVQSSRPVFNSSYNSPIFNFIDNDWVFTYAQNQPLEFNITQYNSNLTSLLGFYAYYLIGLDYESMAKGGGTKYFAMAEQIMNNVPTNAADARGWRPFDGIRNRYWLINNTQASKYEGFRQAIYEYHFLGMDNFYEKPAFARKSIMDAIDKMDKIARENPNAVLVTVFFQAKSDELVNVFSGADMGEKAKALTTLRRADPSNAQKYDKLVRN
jgi:hypothetical protein